jgi:uncharacterized protein
MAPRFAAGDLAGGITAGLDAIFQRIEAERLPTPSGIPRERVDAGAGLMATIVPFVIFGAVIGSLMRRVFGLPGAAMTGVGAGALAGFMLSSLVVGLIAGAAVMLFSFGGGGRGGRVLGGRRGGPVILPGGWSGGGGWGGGGGGGWSSGGGGDAAGGGASGDW